MDVSFDLEMPGNCAQALQLLAAEGAIPLAGGTNVVVDLRAKRLAPKQLVSLDRVAELRGVAVENGRIEIGARTTVTDLLRRPEIAATAPSLVQSAMVFAGQMVRNTATIAGNIACGSPAADLVPPLLSLDAEVTLMSARGQRTLPLASYFVDYRTDVRRPDELITAIAWKRPPERAYNVFYKLARRKGDAITVTGVAVTIAVERGRCTRAHRARGSRAHRHTRAAGGGHARRRGAHADADRCGGARGGGGKPADRRYPRVGGVPAAHGARADAATRRPGGRSARVRNCKHVGGTRDHASGQ